MLTQLTTVKARLGIAPADLTQDDLLTRAIQAVSARFDKECNRTLARTVGATQEFGASELEVVARCYPVESVAKFELSTPGSGWVEVPGVESMVRQGCVICLGAALSYGSDLLVPAAARVTYTGGYVLPGSVPGAGQTALPSDLESAAVEQVSVWYQQRDKLGLFRHWPSNGTYLVFSQQPLLPQVVSMLRPYRRWSI